MSTSPASPSSEGSSASESGTATASGTAEKAKRPHRWWRGIREIVLIVLVALVISTLVRAFVGQVFEIPSSSMEQTILIKDRVIAVKVAPVHRGDVVVFKDPGGWLAPAPARSMQRTVLETIGVLPDTSNDHLIKRLVGMPGDTVSCCDVRGRLQVNGVALDETYINVPEGQAAAAVPFTVVVPARHYFMMGDNRYHSADSRCHLADQGNDGTPQGSSAFVPASDIVGPAMVRVAPLNRLGGLTGAPALRAIPDRSASAPQTASIEPAGVGC